jgi:hypothetical protein
MLEQLVGQGCDVAYDRSQGACKALETLNTCLWQGVWRLCKTDTCGEGGKGGGGVRKQLRALWTNAILTILPGCKGNMTLVLCIFGYSWRIGALLGDTAYGRLAKTAEIKTILSLISPHRGLTTPMSAGCTTLALQLSSGTHASMISHFLSSCLTFHDLHHLVRLIAPF